MKKLSVILVSAALIAPPILLSGPAATQFDENDFDSFMNSAMSDFNGFIDDANREFLDFLRSPWKKFDAEKPVEKRVVPEPEVQPEAAPDAKPDPTPHALTIEEIIDLTSRESGRKGGSSVNVAPVGSVPTPKPEQKPAPATPKPEQKPTPTAPTGPTSQTRPTSPTPTPAPKKEEPEAPVDYSHLKPFIEAPQQKKDGMPLSFAGVTYYVNDALKGVVGSVPLNENGVADAYEALLRADWQPLVKDLKELRAKGLNNDWALYLFVKDVAEKLASGNAAKVLRQFLLNQLGFRARVAIVPSEKRLALYFAPDVQLYGVIFVDVDGVRYYDGDAKSPYAFYMCPKEAPAAKAKIDMDVAAHPAMKGKSRTTTHTGSGRSAGVSVTASVPVQLAEYYSRVPQCDYSVYTGAAVDPTFAASVVSSLRSAVQGKSETEAAAILLDYVQHAFDYATDGQQFGYEKPFFIEELFYYPQCDCEDRSVFYRYLVKEILGLDAVLLEYPNHIATAVRFSNPPGGDYVNIGGKTYTVCDPTYIGAGIGMAMPTFKNTAAKVVKL